MAAQVGATRTTFTSWPQLFLCVARSARLDFNHFTLDAVNGYYRLLVWQFAGIRSAITFLGIGMSEECSVRVDADNVDSIWLRLAMKYGIPGSLMIALALIGSGRDPFE